MSFSAGSEGRLLARLSHPRHPNIVSVFDADEKEGLLYLVMEYVDGETLATRLERGPLAPDEALRLAGDLLAALAVAHAQHVIHRDVKPANIFLRGRTRETQQVLSAASVLELPVSEERLA